MNDLIKQRVEDARFKYLQLRSEHWNLTKLQEDLEAKLIEVTDRLRQLNDGWRCPGEVNRALHKFDRARFPLYVESDFSVRRIVKVDDKYVTVLYDMDEPAKAIRYHRHNGRQERIKTGYRTIDIAAALQAVADAGYTPETLPDFRKSPTDTEP